MNGNLDFTADFTKRTCIATPRKIKASKYSPAKPEILPFEIIYINCIFPCLWRGSPDERARGFTLHIFEF